jgi:hypothetical protein
MATTNIRYVDVDADAGGDGATNALTGANCAYKSLSIWEAARQANLVTGDIIEQCICESNHANHTADTTAVTIDGWTTDATRYIDIKTSASGRHDGKWNTAKYRLDSSSDVFGHIDIVAQNVRIVGLQLDVPANGNNNGIRYRVNSTSVIDIRIDKCIIKGPASGSTDAGLCLIMSSIILNNGVFYVTNNIIYDFTGSTSGAGIICDSGDGLVKLYNNTVVNCRTGISNTSAWTGTTATRNTLLRSCSTAATSGLTAALQDYNATDLASLGYTAQSHDRVSQTFTFVNEGADDFHLASDDAGAKGFGVTDPGSGLFTDDIDGETCLVPWCIGADWITSAAGGLSIPVAMATYKRMGGGR